MWHVVSGMLCHWRLSNQKYLKFKITICATAFYANLPQDHVNLKFKNPQIVQPLIDNILCHYCEKKQPWNAMQLQISFQAIIDCKSRSWKIIPQRHNKIHGKQDWFQTGSLQYSSRHGCCVILQWMNDIDFSSDSETHPFFLRIEFLVHHILCKCRRCMLLLLAWKIYDQQLSFDTIWFNVICIICD